MARFKAPPTNGRETIVHSPAAVVEAAFYTAYEDDGCDAGYLGEPPNYGEGVKKTTSSSPSPHPCRRSRSPSHQMTTEFLAAPR